ncbi:hypothetical protein [Campylobacter concisus]|nr:hypothetical protein [Campylobacter concisus]
MSSIINTFIDIALRSDFPFFHYIFYNFYILFFLRISVDCLKDEVKEQKKLKEVFKWGSLILITFIVLICLTIFESNGIFFYFCIFSWIYTIGVIFWALRPKKFIPDKAQNRNPKKQKKQKVKFEKSKNSFNFTNVKLKNKQSSGDK